jgi:hypothetical protein
MPDKKADFKELSERIEAMNAERDRVFDESRQATRFLSQQKHDMMKEAIAARDAIMQPGIYEGRIVQVYDPDLLDEDTLSVLQEMGTPVLPIEEIFPGGVTIPGRKKKGS